MINSYLSVLAKRLLPAAVEINAYIADGQILGYAREASGAFMPWPETEAFQAEWLVLEAELLQAEQAPEPTVGGLQERIALLEDAIVELLMGGV